ncbi:F-box/WD repeat-containing protein 10 [Pelmatolapia mariae]|uniref:F-box/WD repeat-containing protein 10 n=1 Tax=Pelmatolapia mariae TaxID=158779 RepID=UPI002FE601BD
MRSVNASAEEVSTKTAEGCVGMCGICPTCVFASNPPGSSRCLWKVSDEFKRRFALTLLLRCRSVQVLESIQVVLRGATSWTLHTYARSRSPITPQEHTFRFSHQGHGGKPLGVNVKEIWKWFSSSPDWVKSSYVCRIFSLCDSELLRMVANLTNVLLVRQKSGFLEFNVSNHNNNHDNQEESEDPALMVVPGSSKSVSGVSRHRDFISCLPVDLSKRILGKSLHTTGCSSVNFVSPTYANIVEIPVPVKDDKEEDIYSTVHKLKPFKSAYANIRTTAVQMEERNVYCGAYFTKVLLDNEDPYRVLDYRGGLLLATGSKDRLVRLFYVSSETEDVSVLKGHVGSIQAVLLCENRDLLITASFDASIRCWNLKTDRCDMALYGHTGTVSCLDADADKLVSGAKDCAVKVWCLETGKPFNGFNFKHPSPVLCVKVSKTTIYSSCTQGLVKIWDMENAALLRTIDAHRSAVKCLFLDDWHLLSGDCTGKVMVWSINHNVEKCLITFSHQKEVKSLTLLYLRVITGCVDGKIRIFNFLTGDCLREITAETGTGRLLSLHFLDQSILVNTIYSVKLFQFAKVFWDYASSSRGDHSDVMPQDSLVSEKSAASLRKFPLSAPAGDHVAQLPSTTQKIHSHNCMKPERGERLHRTHILSSPIKCQIQPRVCGEIAKQSVKLSEKAATERIKKRGLHHPLTRDGIHLRVNTILRSQCTEEVSINMESNARLRDLWGPHTAKASLHSSPKQSVHMCSLQKMHDGHPSRAKTCVPECETNYH